MRRLLILSVVLTVLIGLGGPVTAKPGKPKPPAPPKLAVSIDANLWIWNVPGDEILFDLVVENSGSTAIKNVAMSLTIDGVVEYETTVDLGGGGQWPNPDDSIFAYKVPDGREDTNPVTATLEASFGDVSVLDSVTVDGPAGEFWLGRCSEVAPGIESGNPVVFDVGGFCHHTFTPGYWTIVVDPLPGERLALTMRDHVAGNWCMLDEVVRGKPKLPLTIEVFIPGLNELDVELPEGVDLLGEVKWRGSGVCLLGGRGICTEDDCYFPIGNSANFVLATPAGEVTATYYGTEQP